uniref:Uncharacterized protein n=2 Tax=Corethron hystrix TaxID=216773 RepID=A0A7S1FUR8_9STRA
MPDNAGGFMPDNAGGFVLDNAGGFMPDNATGFLPDNPGGFQASAAMPYSVTPVPYYSQESYPQSYPVNHMPNHLPDVSPGDLGGRKQYHGEYNNYHKNYNQSREKHNNNNRKDWNSNRIHEFYERFKCYPGDGCVPYPSPSNATLTLTNGTTIAQSQRNYPSPILTANKTIAPRKDSQNQGATNMPTKSQKNDVVLNPSNFPSLGTAASDKKNTKENANQKTVQSDTNYPPELSLPDAPAPSQKKLVGYAAALLKKHAPPSRIETSSPTASVQQTDDTSNPTLTPDIDPTDDNDAVSSLPNEPAFKPIGYAAALLKKHPIPSRIETSSLMASVQKMELDYDQDNDNADSLPNDPTSKSTDFDSLPAPNPSSPESSVKKSSFPQDPELNPEDDKTEDHPFPSADHNPPYSSVDRSCTKQFLETQDFSPAGTACSFAGGSSTTTTLDLPQEHSADTTTVDTTLDDNDLKKEEEEEEQQQGERETFRPPKLVSTSPVSAKALAELVAEAERRYPSAWGSKRSFVDVVQLR